MHRIFPFYVEGERRNFLHVLFVVYLVGAANAVYLGLLTCGITLGVLFGFRVLG